LEQIDQYEASLRWQFVARKVYQVSSISLHLRLGLCGALLLSACQVPNSIGQADTPIPSGSPSAPAQQVPLDRMPAAAAVAPSITYTPIDLATLPEPIGTKKVSNVDWTGMPNIQPTDGGMPFEGISGIPAVSSLGSRSLSAASVGEIATATGTVRDVLATTILPIVSDWARDGVMVAGSAAVDNAGRIPLAPQSPSDSPSIRTGSFAFQSVSRNECLLFAMNPERTRVYKLAFPTPLSPLSPGVSGALVDSPDVVTTINAALPNPKYPVSDPLAGQIIEPSAMAIGGTLALSVQTFVRAASTVFGPVEPDYQTYPDSRWYLSLHRERFPDGSDRLVWYAMLQPGQASRGQNDYTSELHGGAAKIDARTGSLLMLARPMRSNPEGYRTGLKPTPVPIPPTAIPTPTSPSGYIPSPMPSPSMPATGR
jgi:hypothetical protein